MTYQRFEDLSVWQQACNLYAQMEAFLDLVSTKLRPSFRDQFERAALSISNNIAEGFERGTTNELISFIYIARGSAGEVRSMLCLMAKRPALGDFKSEISNLKLMAESCSRQLRGWADSLQNSPIEGQRRLNDRTRRKFDEAKRSEAFRKRLLDNLPPDHPLRKA